MSLRSNKQHSQKCQVKVIARMSKESGDEPSITLKIDSASQEWLLLAMGVFADILNTMCPYCAAVFKCRGAHHNSLQPWCGLTLP